MLYLTPDDRLILQSVAIEHLQLEFPDPLNHCEIHITKNFVLVIECFDTEILNDVQDYLGLLQYWAWQITGALQIHVTCQDKLICQVQTRRNLHVSLLKALEFESSVNSNLMTNATLEAPTTIASATTTSPQDSLTTELLSLQDLEQRLSTAMKPEQVREVMKTARFPRYVMGGQIGVPVAALKIVFRDWAMKTEQELLQDPAPSVSSTGSTVIPTVDLGADATDTRNGRNGRSRSTKTAGAKTAAGSLDDLKINLTSYGATAQAVLKKLAPNNANRQQQMAQAIAGEKKTASAYMTKILALYAEKGKDTAKVKGQLLKAFSRIATAQPAAVEAAEPATVESAAS